MIISSTVTDVEQLNLLLSKKKKKKKKYNDEYYVKPKN